MKSHYLLKLTCLLLAGMSFNSVSLSAQETKNVTVGNFSGVSASTGIDVYLRQGTTTSAKIVADDDVINEVLLENKDNNLSVKFRDHNNLTGMWKNRSAKVYITYKSLNALAASSGSSIVTENTLKTDKLNARVSSGADISLDLACNDLQLQTSSGASAVLKGKATNMDLKSSSGASIKALELASDYARATSSSGAGIQINVNKGLETTSSSGGNIRYKGTAALNNHSSSRTSNVKRLD